MRFMIIVKSTPESDQGAGPDREMLTRMGAYNEELARAGVMLAAEGLQSSSRGARVKFSGGKTSVIDGPFTESKELVAGFWIWQVRSKEEAIEWLRRAPFDDTEVEIRQVSEMEDFGDALTPELKEQEDQIRAQIARG